MSAVCYEWCVEVVCTIRPSHPDWPNHPDWDDTDEIADRIDVEHYDTYAQCVDAVSRFDPADYAGDAFPDGEYSCEVCIVCDDPDGRRGWAYLADGKLPADFTDSYGCTVRKVPAGFVEEVDAEHRAA